MLLLLIICTSCKDKSPISKKPILETVIANSTDSLLRHVFDNDDYEVQIIYSEINNTNDTDSITKTQEYKIDSERYTYPASTVKFPISILALKKANEIDWLTSESKFNIEGDSITTTIKNEITKIFAVSDNEAYNRLYEFLGRDYINDELKKMGYDITIYHRLSVEDAGDRNIKSLVVFENDSVLLNTKPRIDKRLDSLIMKKTLRGIGYYDDEDLVEQPKSFAEKNYFPLRTQHQMMRDLFLNPEIFNLPNSDIKFIQSQMKILPHEAGYEFYDGYVKFLIAGDNNNSIPEHIEIYNKSGMAYGFLTDNAYVHDTKNDIKFFLTASIFVNKNKIFNDDEYEYDEIGIPFLAKLGRKIYNEKLQKKTSLNH